MFMKTKIVTREWVEAKYPSKANSRFRALIGRAIDRWYDLMVVVYGHCNSAFDGYMCEKQAGHNGRHGACLHLGKRWRPEW